MGKNSKILTDLRDLATVCGLNKPKEKEEERDWAMEAARYGNIQAAHQVNTRSLPRATAAYNFVSLPNKAISSPLGKYFYDKKIDIKNIDKTEAIQQAYADYVLGNLKKGDSYSGEIRLKITTETPCFIGGNQQDETIFFSPAGRPIIGGGSIRGMVKNIFKIITCGAMRAEEDFYNHRLYYRSMSAPRYIPDFKDSYFRRLKIKSPQRTPTGMISITGALPGFLVHSRKDNNYYICKAKAQSPRPNGGGNNEVPKIVWNANGCEFYTGKMRGKRHHDAFTVINWKMGSKPISKKVIDDYREDKRRGGANGDKDKTLIWDIFNIGKKDDDALKFTSQQYDMVVPCYYIADDEENVQSFGFGPFYRIPYKKAIGDHISADMQSENLIDFSDAVFGKKELWASRVFFEDAEWEKIENATLSSSKSHPLMGPNPTSFQLYLNTNNQHLAQHWDLNSQIRGYKLYWHQKCDNDSWRWNEQIDCNIKDSHAITPISAGNVFRSRIRFHDLTSVELGAILKVFDLAKKDTDLRYKIGQGKSLGMGSIKIDFKLFIEDDEKYSTLLDADGWCSTILSKPAETYVAEFNKYIESACKEAGISTSYEILQGELRHLLNWKNTERQDWKEKVRTMQINETWTVGNQEMKPFPSRFVLETVSEIFSTKNDQKNS